MGGPECVDPFVRMESSDCISPSLGQETLVSFAPLGPEECIINPPLRLVDIHFRRHHVEVTGENDRRASCEEFSGIRCKTLEPAELVIELRAGRRIPIREIKTADENAVHCCFDVAALGI